jgi:hypothetical protein
MSKESNKDRVGLDSVEKQRGPVVEIKLRKQSRKRSNGCKLSSRAYSLMAIERCLNII